jgi:hypothetical protein
MQAINSTGHEVGPAERGRLEVLLEVEGGNYYDCRDKARVLAQRFFGLQEHEEITLAGYGRPTLVGTEETTNHRGDLIQALAAYQVAFIAWPTAWRQP